MTDMEELQELEEIVRYTCGVCYDGNYPVDPTVSAELFVCGLCKNKIKRGFCPGCKADISIDCDDADALKAAMAAREHPYCRRRP